MDREALIDRNQRLTAAFHAKPLRHKIRGQLFSRLSHLPIPTQQSRAQRTLFIRPDHIGDMLLSTPAIRAARATITGEIHVLAGAWSAGILEPFTEIDQILTLPFPGFDRGIHKFNLLDPYTRLINAALNLRKVGYRSTVILRRDHWWGAALAFLAGIPERIGYDLPEVAPFLTHAIPAQDEHAIQQSLRLVENWTGKLAESNIPYDFPVNEQDRIYIDGLLKNRGVAPRQPIICIHPGAGTWVKRWSGEKWAAIAETLQEQMSVTAVITGSADEAELAADITRNMRRKAQVISGEINLAQLAALYQRASLVIGADSGPLHIAAAVKTPTVALFGPADPVEFRPWGDPQQHIVLTSDIACRPCRILDWSHDDPQYHPCVKDISIAQVLDAARRILNAL